MRRKARQPGEGGPRRRGMYTATVELGNIDPEFQQLAMNAGRAPERVIAAHCPNQIADLRWDGRPADTATARLPAPVETEAVPMPTHKCLGLGDDRGSERKREQPVKPDKDQPICIPQPEARWRGSLQNEQLVAEECHLGFTRSARSEQSDERFVE